VAPRRGSVSRLIPAAMGPREAAERHGVSYTYLPSVKLYPHPIDQVTPLVTGVAFRVSNHSRCTRKFDEVGAAAVLSRCVRRFRSAISTV
jgi:hypothetical protein